MVSVREFASKTYIFSSRSGLDKERMYEVIQVEGVDLLISRKDFENMIQKSFEFTKEEDIKLLAHRLGIKLRYEQILEERHRMHTNDDHWNDTGNKINMDIDIRAMMTENKKKVLEKKVIKFKKGTLIAEE